MKKTVLLLLLACAVCTGVFGQKKPKTAMEFLIRGLEFAQNGDHKNALKDFNQSIKLDKNNYLAFHSRGIIYFGEELENFTKAIEDFTQAITLKPDFADAYYYRGWTYSIQGNLDKALEDYNRVIELAPDKTRAYNKRGYTHAMKGDLDRAIADFEAALQIDPNDAEAKGYLEKARKQRGR